MMTVSSHPLVHEYLSRLHATAVAALPKGQAEDLLADITEHLDAATDGGTADEARVRSAIDRLGSPDEVVAAALGSASGVVGIPPTSYAGPGTSGALPAAAGLSPSPSYRLERAALALLVLAEITVVALPLALPLWAGGVVCLALAAAWRGRDRVLAWAFVATGMPFILGGLVAGGLVAATAGGSCASGVGADGLPTETICEQHGFSWVAIPFIVLLISYVVVQLLTLRRLTRALR